MTSDEMRAVVAAVEEVMARRLEEVYGTIEGLRQDVADAVQQVRDTAQVLVDNDTALMGQVMARDGDEVAGFVARVGDSWARFIRAEAEVLGWRVVVPKAEGAQS